MPRLAPMPELAPPISEPPRRLYRSSNGWLGLPSGLLWWLSLDRTCRHAWCDREQSRLVSDTAATSDARASVAPSVVDERGLFGPFGPDSAARQESQFPKQMPS